MAIVTFNLSSIIDTGPGAGEYTRRIVDNRNENIIYVGYSQHMAAETNEAKWKIMQVIYSAGVNTIRWASARYDLIWDDRSSYFPEFVNTKSLSFDGVNDYCSAGNNYSFGWEDAFSVSYWIKSTSPTQFDLTLEKRMQTTPKNGWFTFINNNATFGMGLFQTDNPSNKQVYVYTGLPDIIGTGTWSHITCTYTGSKNASGVTLYLDGTSRTKTTAADNLSADFKNTTENLVIGAGDAGSASPFFGNLDEISIWDKALSASEVLEIYNSGVPNDLTQHSAFSNLRSWWRMGDGDTYPTIQDQIGSIDLTMTNMSNIDLVESVPG